MILVFVEFVMFFCWVLFIAFVCFLIQDSGGIVILCFLAPFYNISPFTLPAPSAEILSTFIIRYIPSEKVGQFF